MSIKLEDLDFQRKAIDAAVHIFEGQVRNTFEQATLLGIHRNVIELSTDKLIKNKLKIIKANGISEEDAKLCEEHDYCIEMETGTGKTIVYIRTIYELHRAYKLTKFIILVPSVPIREGVLATFRDFSEPLRDRYGFTFAPFEYDSKKINKLRGFIEDPHPQVMVMTMQSFNTDDNILNRKDRDDALGDNTFLESLGKCRPVVVMDEPQEGMDTENSIARIETLNPSAKLRYSATHKVVKNLLYRLTPADAYRQNLVKKIEVLSVIEQNDEATLKLEFAEYQPDKNGGPPKAKLNAWRNTANGIKWKTTRWLKGPAGNRLGDDLETVTKNVSYRGYVIERIWKDLDDGQNRVRFTNGVELTLGQRDGDRTGLFRLQLEYLIRRHFEKKHKLLPAGIKPLSLIFIDKVANYLSDDPDHAPIIKQLFEDEYAKAFRKHHGSAPSLEQVQAIQGSYFAQTGAGVFTDDKRSMAANKEMYDLILRDKHALLEPANPIEFLFTHSALGVGWDNPNVFNIATLNYAYDKDRKRQEIGRGLRICRHIDGHRVYDALETPEGEETNVLTIVPNETYETFANQYQQQIIDDYGNPGAGSPLRKIAKGKPKKIKLNRREDLFASDAFKTFWDKLARKTDYTVTFDEAALVTRAIRSLNTIQPAKYRAQVASTRLTIDKDDQVRGTDGGSAIKELRATFAPLDIVEELSEASGLAYPTVFKIIAGMDNHRGIAANPARFLTDASEKLRHAETEELLRTLSYKPTGEALPLTDVTQVIETFLDTTPTPNKGVYNAIIHDSKPEQDFAIAADSDTQVICFLKLPKSYKIPIPFGTGGDRTYNPDFGLVLKRKGLDDVSEKDFYFVIETKSTSNINDTRDLTEDERLKMRCAIKHFEALGIEAKLDYKAYHAPVADYAKDFKEKVTH